VRDENVFNLPDDDPRMINLAGHWDREMDEYLVDANDPARITATPFAWPDPALIPRRRFLFGHWLLRGEITAVVAPSGVGKSTITAAIKLSLASGTAFLGQTLPEGACSVWLWNLEDDQDELNRQVTACSLRHGIGAAQCGSRLYVDSGLDQRLCTAIEGERGLEIIEPVYDNLKAEITERGIDALTIDPFVSSHEIDENANVLIDKVVKRWKQLAHETNCAIVLVHHTKKMGGREVRAEDSRGAVALIAAARIVLTINTMTTEEGKRFGITEKKELRSIVRIDNDKANRSPPENATWFRKESVDLGNGDGFNPSDHVGAAVHWTPPDPFDGVDARDLHEVQLAIEAGEYRDSVQAKDWAGKVVAEILGADLDDESEKERVKSLLKGWKASGALTVEMRKVRGEEKPFVAVKNWVDPTTLPTLKSRVGEGAEGADATPNSQPPHPTFYKGGCGGGGVTFAIESGGREND
jgi:hypothetical protein